MINKDPIQVFEFETLRIGDKGFENKHFEALVKFNENNDNKYFKPVFKGIKFGNYVGVIQINGLTIEILPKANRNENGDKAIWQKVLLNMLSICKKIQIDNISEAQLKKRYNSILEVYFEMYLQEIDQLIRKGLIKKYRKNQSNQNALKGKLLFVQNIQKNVVHKERFYCEHQVYDKDHIIHQILLEGLNILNSFNGFALKDKVQRQLFEFENVESKKINTKHFESLKLNKKNRPYHKALEIAKMLILNYSPNISTGNDNMLTLLFDMNKLWEEYIFRILHQHNNGYEVSPQNIKTFWESKTIRPDIVLTRNKEVIIIDTKWKIIKDTSKPDDSDLKQMFVYNLYWKSEKSLLLYPQTDQVDSAFGSYIHNPIHLLNDEYIHLQNKCKLGFINVLENNVLKDPKKISDEIFAKLKEKTLSI